MAILASFLFLSGCTDGLDPSLAWEGSTLQLSLLPRLSADLTTEGSLPINRLRITAFEEESADTIGVLIEDVDPAAEAWTVTVQMEVPPTENPNFYIIVELINVGEGVEAVQWSGRSPTLPLTIGTIPEIREVAVGRGPLANLKVTSVVIDDHPEEIEEGSSVYFRAEVTTTDLEDPPTLFWASLNSSFALVSGDGLVTGVRPGDAVIVAMAGMAADTTVLTIGRRPAGITLAPDSVVLHSLGDSISFQAAVIDPRGVPMEEESVLWEVESPETLLDLGEGLFRAVGSGSTVVLVRSVRVPSLLALGRVSVDQIPARVEVTPDEVKLGSIGAAVQLSAASWDANGHSIPDAEYSWVWAYPVSVDR